MSPRARSVWCLAVVLSSPAWAQVTQRVSVGSGGVQGDFDSLGPTISADGRYVAFASIATNLVPGDTNGAGDCFVRDRQSGTIERVSVDSSGAQANFGGLWPSISADGRFVAFPCSADNLVPGDTNGQSDIFVRDRLLGTTVRVSVDSGGIQGDDASFASTISADGRFVAFTSLAGNLVPGDSNGRRDIFVRDRLNGTTESISVTPGGSQGNADSDDAALSADGRFVAFWGRSDNLVPGDVNLRTDVLLRDRQAGTTELVSVDNGGAQGNGDSSRPWISADGRYVVFMSYATNLVPGDTNGRIDIFVRDRLSGTTERVNLDTSGAQTDGDSYEPRISSDGRFVAFSSIATNLVPGDANGVIDVFLRDRQSGTTEILSVDSSGAHGNLRSLTPSISSDGRFVAYWSDATDLVPGDTNGASDVFVRDRVGGTSFTSSCDPGVGGVIGCPCSNPPGGPDRGCDNSSGTGGAALSASGGAFLSSDSLTFTTSGERPTVTSILLQGSSSPAAGVVYGQGVRCVGGTLKRLYTKPASGGSITAPDFGAGEPPVSVRSAAIGDVIQAGQSRWYLVFYRDQVVLGGCPANRTFNATQTGRVDWSF